MMRDDYLKTLYELLLESSVRSYSPHRDVHLYSPRRRALPCRLSYCPKQSLVETKPPKPLEVLGRIEEKYDVIVVSPTKQLFAVFRPNCYSNGKLMLKSSDVRFDTIRKIINAVNAYELLDMHNKINELRVKEYKNETYIRKLHRMQANMYKDFLDYEKVSNLITRIKYYHYTK